VCRASPVLVGPSHSTKLEPNCFTDATTHPQHGEIMPHRDLLCSLDSFHVLAQFTKQPMYVPVAKKKTRSGMNRHPRQIRMRNDAKRQQNK
jgi:hypothetical protein